jgi:hypothetical protein
MNTYKAGDIVNLRNGQKNYICYVDKSGSKLDLVFFNKELGRVRMFSGVPSH